MSILEKQAEFYSYMREYADFLESMLAGENEKLAALLSNELVRIEHSISQQQATAKQLENIERKRQRLQAEAGFEDMSFSQIMAVAEPEMQSRLQRLFDKIQNTLEEIKFLNSKSMNVVKTNLDLHNSRRGGNSTGNYGYSKEQAGLKTQHTSLLETKV